MKIGLMRHFRVIKEYPPWWTAVTQDEVLRWFDEYDEADVQEKDVHLGGVAWDVCFASDLRRARETARAVYKGRIIEKPEIREFKLYPICKKNVRLPYFLWPVFIRIAWHFNHRSQRPYRREGMERIRKFVDELVSLGDKNVLVVSHGALMIYLRKELIRRGFRGPSFGRPENGVLYVFEKKA